MVEDARYQQELRALEDKLRPTSRRVLPYLVTGSRRGLADAAAAADRHADALDRLEPPSEVLAAHQDYVSSLRALADDARELTTKKAWGRRRLVADLRALPSFKRTRAARELLLKGCSED